MPLTTNMQVNIIIYSILAGILTGILFDTYRIVRGFKIPKFVLVIQDILFWILSALVIFIFLLYTNYAFLGVYVYAIIIITLFIYLKIISKFVLNMEKYGLRCLGKVSRVVMKNILYPFKLIYFNIIRDKNKKITWIK